MISIPVQSMLKLNTETAIAIYGYPMLINDIRQEDSNGLINKVICYTYTKSMWENMQGSNISHLYFNKATKEICGWDFSGSNLVDNFTDGVDVIQGDSTDDLMEHYGMPLQLQRENHPYGDGYDYWIYLHKGIRVVAKNNVVSRVEVIR